MTAAAYARYSTDHQTENSIEYQLEKIRAYCAEKEITIAATYTDEARTGTNVDRPGFQAMLKAAARGDFDAVVIYDISRGSRDVGDWFQFRRAMMELGIAVLSATQPLGDLTDSNDFLLELLSVGLGQREVLETRRKSMDGVDVRARQGAFLGGTPPLGYKVVRGRYVVDENEAQTVRRIFSMYADGCSYSAILAALKDVRSRRGNPLTYKGLQCILRNERYTGVYTWCLREQSRFGKWAGGRPSPRAVRIEGAVPPIIDRATWERVSRRMSDRSRNAANAAKREYMLSGLIVCESCGARYCGRTVRADRKGGPQYVRYYTCGRKYRAKDPETACHNPNIPADKLEAFVVEQVGTYLRTCDIDAEAERLAAQINRQSPDLSAEKRELAELNRKLTNGYRAIMDGFDDPDFRAMVGSLRRRKAELESLIHRRESARPHVTPGQIREALRKSIADWETRRKEVVREHIQRITAHADGTITVHIRVHTTPCGGAQWVVYTSKVLLRFQPAR